MPSALLVVVVGGALLAATTCTAQTTTCAQCPHLWCYRNSVCTSTYNVCEGYANNYCTGADGSPVRAALVPADDSLPDFLP